MTKHMDGKWSWWFCVQPLIYLLSCICKWYDSIRLWYCHYMMKERTWVFLPALFVNLRSLFSISLVLCFSTLTEVPWMTYLLSPLGVVFLCLFPRLLFFPAPPDILWMACCRNWQNKASFSPANKSSSSTDTSLGYFSLLFILVSLQFSSLSWRKLQKERRHESKRLSHTKLIHEFLSLSLSRHPSSSSIIDRLRQTEQELNRKQIAA